MKSTLGYLALQHLLTLVFTADSVLAAIGF